MITPEELVKKLTYNNNTKDSIINYGLILFGLAIVVSKRNQRIGGKIIALVVLIQIIILLHSKTTGVSLIWCAILGYILSTRNTKRTLKEKAYIILSSIVIVYYAYYFGALSTIAHIGTVGLSMWLSTKI